MKKSIILAVAFVFALAVCAPVASVAQEPVKKEQSAEKPADKKSDKKEGCCKGIHSQRLGFPKANS